MTTAAPALKSAPRQRVPNGVASKRLRVAMPPALLEQVEAMAAAQMRTASAMVTKLVAERLADMSKSDQPALQHHSAPAVATLGEVGMHCECARDGMGECGRAQA